MNNKIFGIRDKWLDIIYQALINLNGAGKYKSIYKEVLRIAPDKCGNNKNWQNRVRETIQSSSSDSKYFKSSNKDLFISLEGIGKGSWGIRDFIQPKTYLDVMEMINEFKSILIDDWHLGKEVNVLNSMLDKKARNNFRSKVISSRSLENISHYSDLEKMDISTNNNLDVNTIFTEAAHIFDVWCIKKLAIEYKKNDLKDDKTIINLLNSLDDTSNALLLPFNYHKIFDMNLIWFDENTGYMNFNEDFKEDFAKLGIYQTRIKSNVMENKDIKKYLSIRNKYRENKLKDIWKLFNSNIINFLEI